MKNRTAFFISDGTGITAETLGNSLLSQFDQTQFRRVILPYIDSIEKAEKAVQKINKALIDDGEKPIIFDTVINTAIRSIISKSNGYMIDIFSTFLEPLESELGEKSSYSVGKSHSIVNDSTYEHRIDAVNYALENDDGARTFYYNKADVILVGVSRSGKTPTCLYLALQFGVYAANYPITEEDLEEMQFPKALREHKNKLFGLTIDPHRLANIRNERRANSRYSSMKQCEREVHDLESLFRKENIPFLNTTFFSVEEISTKIMLEKNLERRA